MVLVHLNYAQGTLEVCSRYARSMLKVRLRYARSMLRSHLLRTGLTRARESEEASVYGAASPTN